VGRKTWSDKGRPGKGIRGKGGKGKGKGFRVLIGSFKGEATRSSKECATTFLSDGKRAVKEGEVTGL